MAGRRRAPDTARATPAREAESDRSSQLDDQSLMGNQALTSRLGGEFGSDEALGLAREVALPLVDHGVLALEVDGLGADKLARFQQIIEASGFERGQRAAIAGRLAASEAMASDVAEAVRKAFGGDDDDARGDASRALDAITEALQGGQPSEGRWRLPDGREVAISETGSRAHALVEAVGDAVAGPGRGASILAFCQRSQLALFFDEDEEELPDPAYEPT